MTRTTALHLDDDLVFVILDRELALLRIESQAEAIAEDIAAAVDAGESARIRAIANATREHSRLRLEMPRVTGGATTAADVDRALRLALVRRGVDPSVLPAPHSVTDEEHVAAA